MVRDGWIGPILVVVGLIMIAIGLGQALTSWLGVDELGELAPIERLQGGFQTAREAELAELATELLDEVDELTNIAAGHKAELEQALTDLQLCQGAALGE